MGSRHTVRKYAVIGVVFVGSLLLVFSHAEGQERITEERLEKGDESARVGDQEIKELRRQLVELEEKRAQEIKELKARLTTLENNMEEQSVPQERTAATTAADGAPGGRVSAPPEGRTAPLREPRRAGPAGVRSEESILEQTRLEVGDLQERLPFTLGASAWLYYFQPLKSRDFGGDNLLELYSFYLDIAKEWDNGYGFATTLRFRDTKLRSWHPSNIYALEVYASKQTPVGKLKLGKFFKQVGYFWDDSFFGNVQYFDGLKLDPDFGVELAGERRLGQRWRLPYFFQFFLTDDGYHGGLTERDAESSPATREKNTGVIRFVPTYEFGSGRSLALGGSFLRGRIDRQAGTGRDNDLTQLAADVAFTWSPLLAYGEFLYQDGRNSIFFPRPGGSSSTRYWLAGVQYDWGRFNWRTNFSLADYKGGITEYIVQPGVVYSIAEGLKLWLEYDFWRHRERGDERTVDQSINVALHVQF